MTLELSGVKDASCGVSISSVKVDLGRVDLAGRANVAFSISCNTPFVYALVSQHGALTLDKGDDAGPRVPYRVTTNLQTTNAGLISDSCASGDLKTGVSGCMFSTPGDAVAAGEPSYIDIAWDKPSGVLPAGTYEDELILTLYPRT